MTTTNQFLVRNVQADRTVLPPERSGFSKRISVCWDAVVNFIVPVGYEDQSGFHYGEQSASYGSVHVDANSR